MTNSSIHAPEVSLSTNPEVDHDPQSFPPEVALVEGAEVKYDGLEHLDLDQSQPMAKKQLQRKRNVLKLMWPWTILCAAVIIALGVGVGVGVGNNVKHRSRSLASTVCPNSERWVFFQDPQGYLRGAQYRNAKWTVTSRQIFKDGGLNLVTPMPGTSLGASCFINFYSGPSFLVQVAFIGIYGGLWLSLIGEGTWYPPYVFGNTSAKNTKISIFTKDRFLEGSGFNSSDFSSKDYSSVAFFQRGNGSYAVAGLSIGGFPADPALAFSPLSAERRLSDVAIKQSASFACVMNVLDPDYHEYLSMDCFINDTMWGWQYQPGSLSNQTKDISPINRIYTLWQLDEGKLTLTRKNRHRNL